jgi:hypothetical protein
MGHIRRRKLDHGRTAYLARYRGPDGRERSKQFAKRADAERFLSAAEVTRADSAAGVAQVREKSAGCGEAMQNDERDAERLAI